MPQRAHPKPDLPNQTTWSQGISPFLSTHWYQAFPRGRQTSLVLAPSGGAGEAALWLYEELLARCPARSMGGMELPHCQCREHPGGVWDPGKPGFTHAQSADSGNSKACLLYKVVGRAAPFVIIRHSPCAECSANLLSFLHSVVLEARDGHAHYMEKGAQEQMETRDHTCVCRTHSIFPVLCQVEALRWGTRR